MNFTSLSQPTSPKIRAVLYVDKKLKQIHVPNKLQHKAGRIPNRRPRNKAYAKFQGLKIERPRTQTRL